MICRRRNYSGFNAEHAGKCSNAVTPNPVTSVGLAVPRIESGQVQVVAVLHLVQIKTLSDALHLQSPR